MVQTLRGWIVAAAPVRIRVRRMEDARQQRRKPSALDRLAGGQGDCPDCATVQDVVKVEDGRAPCRVAHQLDPRHYRLLARSSYELPLLLITYHLNVQAICR